MHRVWLDLVINHFDCQKIQSVCCLNSQHHCVPSFHPTIISLDEGLYLPPPLLLTLPKMTNTHLNAEQLPWKRFQMKRKLIYELLTGILFPSGPGNF